MSDVLRYRISHYCNLKKKKVYLCRVSKNCSDYVMNWIYVLYILANANICFIVDFIPEVALDEAALRAVQCVESSHLCFTGEPALSQVCICVSAITLIGI